MAILSFEAQEVEYVPLSRGETVSKPGPSAINDKNKDTLLSQTLKVEEKKVPLFC